MKVNFKVEGKCIISNNSVEIIFDACRSCYAIEKEMNFEEKKNYIGRRIISGHESILEHSNLVFIIVSESDIIDNFLSECHGINLPGKYLNIKVKNSNCIIIGGSVRAYKHLIKNIMDRTNKIYIELLNLLYKYTIREYYLDLENSGIIEMNRFKDNEFMYNRKFNKVKLNNIQIISTDLYDISDFNVEVFSKDELITNINITDLLDFYTVTILFENMSRTATHQLVRHRNAITQESQRYVNYSNAGFTVPPSIKSKDGTVKRYNIEIEGHRFNIDLEGLGKDLCSIYSQLLDQGLKKEEARAFLPSNTQCGKLYMTFTLRNLISFLYLRTDVHAQSEIREYALEIEKYITDVLKDKDIYSYLLSTYLLSEVNYDYEELQNNLNEE